MGGKDSSYVEVRDNILGWDVTDYGESKFSELRFTLITFRKGNLNNIKYYKAYSEKLLIFEKRQYAPMHYH